MHKLGHCCTTVEHLGVRLGRRDVLTDVNFSLHCGELTAVIGRNGAGKTTLLRALLGQIPFSGRVGFRDHSGAPKKLHLGYVPQRTSLDPSSPATVYDLCAAYLSKKPVFLMRDKRLAAEIQKHLEDFGAGELLHRKIADLSGGEWQRVMLSLATHPVPELLILDEPASGIDQKGLEVFYQKLELLKTGSDLSILLVSHDFSALPRYADKLILLDGVVRMIGSPSEVFHSAAFRETFGEVPYV